MDLRLTPSGDLALMGLSFRLRLPTGWIGPEAFRQIGLEPTTSGGQRLRCTGGPATGPEAVELLFTPPASPNGAWSLLPRLTAASNKALDFLDFELHVPAGGLRLPGLGAELHLLHNGYQSWSFTGALTLKAPFAPLCETDETTAFKGGLGDPTLEKLGISYWFTLLAGARKGPFFVIGATTARKHRTAISLSLPASGTAGLALRQGTLGETHTVAAGATVELEGVAIAQASQEQGALSAYASAIAARETPLRQEAVQSPLGFWSWNYFFSQVTEKDILAQAAFLKQNLASQGFRLIELDDGYESQWGDWEQTRSTFPSGLSGLAKQVQALGLSIGIWTAPFLVDDRSTLVKDHPEYFVKDAQGNLLKHQQLGVDGTMRVLDPTHPGAQKHLGDLFGRLAQAGYSLFKLDFLYAAALPGKRYVPGTTGIEALRLGLELIRKAAPKAHINLCGMPFLPAVGRGHSLRFGTDIAFANLTLGPVQIAHEARNVMLRGFFDTLIRNDPDQALLRPPLTEDMARQSATLAAMTGFYSVGDDLTQLSNDRLSLLTNSTLLRLAQNGRSGYALDLFENTGEKIIPSPVLDLGLIPHDPQTVAPQSFFLELSAQEAFLAVFNWAKQSSTKTVDLSRLGIKNINQVKEVWTQAALTPTSNQLTLTLKPHSVALLQLGSN